MKQILTCREGFLPAIPFGKLNASFTWFNPFTDSYFFVAALSINF